MKFGQKMFERINMTGSIRGALAQIGAKSFDVRALAMRHAPIPEREYTEVLVDSGRQGRMFRAMVNLTETPIADLRITNVSGFGRQERNLFAAFADALEYRVVQRIKEIVPYSIGRGICNSQYAIERRSLIQNVNDYYYLTPFHETDVVLAPETCKCCFDFAYLDYMKSCFELTRQGALLVIRFGPQIVDKYLKSPLVSWMNRAGFEETWFFGADKISEWEEQSDKGEGFSFDRESRLFALSDVFKESDDLFLRLFPGVDNYLVFQRTASPHVSTMLALFLEIIEWEKAHMEQRITTSASRIVKAQEFLATFKETLPNQ